MTKNTKKNKKIGDIINLQGPLISMVTLVFMAMSFYGILTSDLWPFISTEEEIGASYLEYFTNNINDCQITKEGKKKKRLVI
jgi:hypothetical protein